MFGRIKMMYGMRGMMGERMMRGMMDIRVPSKEEESNILSAKTCSENRKAGNVRATGRSRIIAFRADLFSVSCPSGSNHSQVR